MKSVETAHFISHFLCCLSLLRCAIIVIVDRELCCSLSLFLRFADSRVPHTPDFTFQIRRLQPICYYWALNNIVNSTAVYFRTKQTYFDMNFFLFSFRRSILFFLRCLDSELVRGNRGEEERGFRWWKQRKEEKESHYGTWSVRTRCGRVKASLRESETGFASNSLVACC